MIQITPERRTDAPAIESLLDAAFGPNRLAKSSYSYRDQVERIRPLCMVARDEGAVVGTIRYWPIAIGTSLSPALLLGPIAVAETHRCDGIGARLMRVSLAAAASRGHRLVVLVGDEPYYRRFGFVHADRFGIEMARENPARVLALPLAEQIAVPTGLVQRWRSVRAIARAA